MYLHVHVIQCDLLQCNNPSPTLYTAVFSYLSIANDDLFGSPQVEEEGDEDTPLSKGSGLFSKSSGGGGGLFGDNDEEDDNVSRDRTESNASSKSSGSTKRKLPAGAVPLFGGGGGGLFGDDDEGELEQSIMSTTSTSSKVITCTLYM